MFRRHLWWALACGAVTALLVGVYLQRLSRLRAEAPRVPVVVAARAVEAGTVLTAEMLRVEQWPQEVRLPGALPAAAAAAGQRAAVPFVAGQPVLRHQIAPPDQAGHGGPIPPGMRLITIPVDEQSAIGYRLRAGDRVDVIGIYQDRQALHADLLLQGIQVHAVGAEGAAGRDGVPRTVTLLVTPGDGLTLSLAVAGGSVRLLLRGAGDVGRSAPGHFHRYLR